MSSRCRLLPTGNGRPYQQRGLTAVELLVVIAIVAVLATVAAPSFRDQIQSAQIGSAVNTFISDVRFARSEAVRRGSTVVLCRSDAPTAASPQCGTSQSLKAKDWVSGWIVFEDRDKNSTYSAKSDGPLLRVQASWAGTVDSILEIGNTTSSNTFVFTALGRQRTLSDAATLAFGSSKYSGAQRRMVCVNLVGLARVASDGVSKCSTSN